MEKQMKDLAWNVFKQTGDINTFLEFKKIENIEKNQLQNQLGNIEEIQYGNYKDQGNHSF